jgi:general secretion pathway protein K
MIFIRRDKKKPFLPLQDSGVAMLIALMVITVLVALTVESHRKVRGMAQSAVADRVRGQLEWTARGGVVLAQALLLENRRKSTNVTIQDDWARPDKIQLALLEAGQDPANLSVAIVDCLSLIQVNALGKPPHSHEFNPEQQQLWDRFLRPIFSEHETDEINPTTSFINSLKDWLDREDDDATTGLTGAESDYYLRLDPPYRARNGPMLQEEELLLVKGMTPEIYLGAYGIKPVAPFVTVCGAALSADRQRREYPGRINISTAPLEVLEALLPPEDADLASSMAAFRLEQDGDTFINNLAPPAWYKNAPGCADLEIDPKLVTTTSNQFIIYSTAKKDSFSLTIRAVVELVQDIESSKWDISILEWEIV